MLVAELRKAFGGRLRALRKQHHWTLKELAAQLNVLPPQLNKYECGLNWPPADKIIEIAALFHISLDYLLQGSAQDTAPVHNHRLLERFRALEAFPADDQDTVIKLIDAMIIKQRVAGALSSLNALSPAPASAHAPALSDAHSPAPKQPNKPPLAKSARSKSANPAAAHPNLQAQSKPKVKPKVKVKAKANSSSASLKRSRSAS